VSPQERLPLELGRKGLLSLSDGVLRLHLARPLSHGIFQRLTPSLSLQRPVRAYFTPQVKARNPGAGACREAGLASMSCCAAQPLGYGAHGTIPLTTPRRLDRPGWRASTVELQTSEPAPVWRPRRSEPDTPLAAIASGIGPKDRHTAGWPWPVAWPRRLCADPCCAYYPPVHSTPVTTPILPAHRCHLSMVPGLETATIVATVLRWPCFASPRNPTFSDSWNWASFQDITGRLRIKQIFRRQLFHLHR